MSGRKMRIEIAAVRLFYKSLLLLLLRLLLFRSARTTRKEKEREREHYLFKYATAAVKCDET